MSRVYKIELTQQRTAEIRGQDAVDTELQLIDILPRDQMADTLRVELTRRGFELEVCGKLSRTADGVTAQVDPETGRVTIGLTLEQTQELEVSRATSYDEDFSTEAEAKAKLSAELDDVLAEQAATRAEALRQEATSRLEAALPGVRQLLRDVEAAVMREALQVKARSLGEVQEVHEDVETGEITIRVRV